MDKPEGKTLLRVKSHRAGKRLAQLTGPVDWHYRLAEADYFALVDDTHLTAALRIPGITRARVDLARVRRCRGGKMTECGQTQATEPGQPDRPARDCQHLTPGTLVDR